MDIIEESIIHRFMGVTSKLGNYCVFKKKKRLSDYLLKVIYKVCGEHIKSNVFYYNHVAFSFNKIYFWKNLLKNMIFFDRYYYLIEDRVLDAGCGAAPSSIAIDNVIKFRKRKNISFLLLERSKNQLLIAKDITRIMNIEIKTYMEDCFDMERERFNELVVFSYFFCEQKRDFIKKLFINRRKFIKGFVVIDYKYNIMKIKQYFYDNGDKDIESVFLDFLVPPILFEFIHDREISVNGCFYRP